MPFFPTAHCGSFGLTYLAFVREHRINNDFAIAGQTKQKAKQRDFFAWSLTEQFFNVPVVVLHTIRKIFGRTCCGFGIEWVQESASTQLDFESFWVVVIAFAPPTHHNIRMCFIIL